MAEIIHYHDDDGYFVRSAECPLDPLESIKCGHDVPLIPANACLEAPEIVAGHIPRRVNGRWTQVENHKDEKGYVNGRPHTITDYGPYPDGWSAEPPLPTVDALFARLRTSRDARLTATDKYLLADYPVSADNLALVKAYRAALRTLPEQTGAPWDGGDESTPWPVFPEALQGSSACA